MNRPERISHDARHELLQRMLRGEAGAAAPQPRPIPARDPARRVPLTSEQSQLWLHAELAPEMPLYNESITIHRFGRYDHAALEQALSEIVRRHAIWRTAFIEQDGELVQKIARPAPIALPIIDISDLPADQRDAEAVRLATEDARAPIALDQAPLFRARVVLLSETEHRLYLTLHHIIFDGVSIYRTLVPELATLVAAYERGNGSPLPEPALQYADYAVWQADQLDAATEARQLAYWRGALAEPLPRLEVAGDRSRPAQPTHAGSMETFALPDHLIEELREIARAEGATLYMVLLAVFKAMLFRYTGDTDIIVGGVTDTRRRPELQPLMGYFLNTMALRSQPEGSMPFRDYLARVKAAVIGALGASDIPFNRLIRALDIKRGKGTHPLFNTLFSIEPPVEPFPQGWDLTQMDVTVGAAKYDLYLELDERHEDKGGGMVGRFLYSTELFDPATIHRMIGHWTRMLEGVAADVTTPLASLPMLGGEERRQLVEGWNQTARPLGHATVVDWFGERLAETPNATAIEQDGKRWSYAELSKRADAIAARLAAEGVEPGALVGLCLARTPWMVAAMLGVARAGAAYLPLDPGFPPSRLAMIVEDAAPTLILVEPETAEVLAEAGARQLELERNWPAAAAPPRALGGEDLAYVLYTSGSTGRPKGVEIPHAALVNLLLAMQEQPGFAPGESLLAITTLSFDIAELELWLPLVTGGKVILASREQAIDMYALDALIAAARPDVLQATPATWRGLIEAGWEGAPWLRAYCGGEAMPRALADQLLPRVGELWNVYGPTETTIWSTVAKVEPGEGPVPIGRPIANTSVRVLDREGNDRPLGAIGELHIGGRGLARGYRGREDMTAERFVTIAGERLYKTGDLARWRADGVLMCLGRTDHEEKIRGFRVAIEEIESALARLPGVAATAVRAWPDASGERALAAYVVGAGDPAEWREALGAVLPEYMIPARFEILEALPLTPNGKVDRNALPEPGAMVGRNAEPPATPDELRLAAIWSKVLKVENVSRDDDFFELGGHSLLIARLLRMIEAEYGMRMPMAALFRAPKLRDMAALLTSGSAIESPALAPIQPNGDKTPVIWLDGGSTFLPLAEQLGRDQPFLGLSVDVVLETSGKSFPNSFEKAARLVAEEVRRIQPRGPYRFGGWCTSGIMAYALAAHMRAEGDDVELVILAHAFHPPAARKVSEISYFFSKLRFHLDHTRRQPKGKRLRYFLERLYGMSDAAGLMEGGREAILQPAMRKLLDKSAIRYVPPHYAGDVLLFQPEQHPDVLDFIDDWGAVISGRYDAHVVPGGHRTMLEQPNVIEVARIIEEALARRDRRRAA
jgi:amino acid adenylation domain-containing protein